MEPGLLAQVVDHVYTKAGLAVLAVLGFGLAFYFYYVPNVKPDLTVYVSQNRTPIVQKGNLDNFSVSFLGKPIESDLSAITIQVWNNGNAPIRGDDILKAFKVFTAHNDKIYQTTHQESRDVIGFNWINSTNDGTNTIEFTWKILEKGDSIKLQMIYGGPITNDDIFVDCAIVGQKTVSIYTKHDKVLIWFGIIYPMILLCAIFLNVLKLKNQMKGVERIVISHKMFIVYAVLLLLVILMFSHALHKAWEYGFTGQPPFGF